MKTKFIVGVREVHVSYRRVEAGSPQKALELVRDDNDILYEIAFEYSHTLDSDLWSVEQDYINDYEDFRHKNEE